MNQKIWSKDIIFLLAASFFYMASPMLVTPLITGFSESLGAGPEIMGLVGGLTSLCALVFQPFAGNLADQYSKHKLSTAGVFLLVLACIGYVAAVNPAMILICRVINGLGFACCSVCFSTWIANLLPRERIGFGMGIYGMMNALAMAISPAIGVAVYHRYGYRVALILSVVFAVLCGLLIQWTDDKGLPIRNSGKDAKKFRLVEKSVIPIALVIMCFGIPYCATQSFLVRYAETRGLNVAVGMFFTIYAAALLILRVIFRNFFDKLSFMVFMIVGSLCALGAMGFLFCMNTNLHMAAAAVLMAGGYGIMCTVSQSAAVLAAKPENRGMANSTYYIGMNSGMALGSMIGGFLYGNLPIEMFYPAMMIAAPMGFVLYFASKKLIR